MEINRTLSRLKNSVEEALTPIIRKGENLTPADLENATKAMLMGAGVLIAILILSILVVLFSSYKSLPTSYDNMEGFPLLPSCA